MDKYDKISRKMYNYFVQQIVQQKVQQKQKVQRKLHTSYVALLIKQFVLTKLVKYIY